MGKKTIRYRAWTVLFLALTISGCNSNSPGTGNPSRSVKPEPAYEGTIVAVGDSLTAGLGVRFRNQKIHGFTFTRV